MLKAINGYLVVSLVKIWYTFICSFCGGSGYERIRWNTADEFGK